MGFWGFGVLGNTAIASQGHYQEMVILQQSTQCAPLLRFKKPMAPDKDTDQAIWHAHKRLQSIVDVFLNNGATTNVVTVERIQQQHRGQRVLTPPVVRAGNVPVGQQAGVRPHFAMGNFTPLTPEERIALCKRKGLCVGCGRLSGRMAL